jgi:hypothetical protein
MTDSELAQLKRDVQILKDTEAVKKVKHAYFRCIDTANLEELRGLLHPKMSMPSWSAAPIRSNSTTARNISRWWRIPSNAEFVGMHHGHHPEIEISERDRSDRRRWYLQDIAIDFRRKVTTTGSSIYHDKYTQDRRQVADLRHAIISASTKSSKTLRSVRR